MSFRYRDHRGGYVESMATVQTFNNYNELVFYLQNSLTEIGASVHHEDIDIQPYGGIDDRNGWDTHVITATVKGESMVLGFTDQWVLPILNTKFVVRSSSEVTPDYIRRLYVSIQELSATRKNDSTITIRLRPKVPSKLNGRQGTRRDWKRQHPPLSADILLYLSEEKSITWGLIEQRLLSSKHL